MIIKPQQQVNILNSFYLDLRDTCMLIYADYNGLPNITLIGCWTHARSKFDEALKALPVLKAMLSEHVFRLRMKLRVNTLYVHAFLNSELGQLQLETVTSGGAQGKITRDFAEVITFHKLMN